MVPFRAGSGARGNATYICASIRDESRRIILHSLRKALNDSWWAPIRRSSPVCPSHGPRTPFIAILPIS